MSSKKILSPVELYDKEGVMEDFVLEEVNDLLAKERPGNPWTFLTFDRSKLKSILKKAAEQHRTKYQKKWVKLLPVYLADAGWNVEITSWGYRLYPKNLSIEDDSYRGRSCEEED